MNETALSEIESQLLGAYREKQWEKGKKIFELAQKTDEFEKEKAELERKQNALKEEYSVLAGKEPVKEFKGRKLRLPVPRGAIDHKYLLVTRALADRLLSSNEKLKIHVPVTGVTFETYVYRRNNILNERFYIGRFYKAAGIQPGDFVLLDESSPGEWNLIKCNGPVSDV
jgi:hypothetical protein